VHALNIRRKLLAASPRFPSIPAGQCGLNSASIIRLACLRCQPAPPVKYQPPALRPADPSPCNYTSRRVGRGGGRTVRPRCVLNRRCAPSMRNHFHRMQKKKKKGDSQKIFSENHRTLAFRLCRQRQELRLHCPSRIPGYSSVVPRQSVKRPPSFFRAPQAPHPSYYPTISPTGNSRLPNFANSPPQMPSGAQCVDRQIPARIMAPARQRQRRNVPASIPVEINPYAPPIAIPPPTARNPPSASLVPFAAKNSRSHLPQPHSHLKSVQLPAYPGCILSTVSQSAAPAAIKKIIFPSPSP